MSQIINILEGWGNVVRNHFDMLDSDTKSTSTSRLVHCDNCDLRTSNSCDTDKYGYHVKTGKRTYGCGCNIAAKTLARNSECPLGKW
jgi:hypothetical protein